MGQSQLSFLRFLQLQAILSLSRKPRDFLVVICHAAVLLLTTVRCREHKEKMNAVVTG